MVVSPCERRGGGGEADRHRLDAVHEVGVEAVRRAGQLDVGQALDDLAHGRLDLGAGEAGAEAEVLAAAAEGHVVVGRAADVEGVRVLEHLLVAVGGGVVHDDLVALLDRHAADLGVACGGAPEVVDRRCPSGASPPRRCPRATGRRGGARAWSGCSMQGEHRVVDEVPGGLVAGDDQRDEEEVELGVGEPLAVDLGVHERRHDVVARVRRGGRRPPRRTSCTPPSTPPSGRRRAPGSRDRRGRR